MGRHRWKAWQAKEERYGGEAVYRYIRRPSSERDREVEADMLHEAAARKQSCLLSKKAGKAWEGVRAGMAEQNTHKKVRHKHM